MRVQGEEKIRFTDPIIHLRGAGNSGGANGLHVCAKFFHVSVNNGLAGENSLGLLPEFHRNIMWLLRIGCLRCGRCDPILVLPVCNQLGAEVKVLA